MILISYRPLSFLELYSVVFEIISYYALIYARLLFFRNKVQWNMLNPFLFFLVHATQSRPPPSGGFCDEFRYRLSCQLIEWAAARECACLHCMLIDTGVLLPALLPGPVRSTGSVLQSHKQRLQLYGSASIKLVSEFLLEDWAVPTTIVVWFTRMQEISTDPGLHHKCSACFIILLQHSRTLCEATYGFLPSLVLYL